MNKAQDDFTRDIKININKIDSKDKKPILIDELYSSDEENEDFLNENEITELLNESKNKNIANLFKQENDDSFIINKKDNMTLFSKTFNKYDYIKNWNKQIKDFNSTITNNNADDDIMTFYDPKIIDKFIYQQNTNIKNFIIKEFNLNFEQQIAFILFTEKFFNRELPQKLLKIAGSGGTGKSEIIKAIQHFFFLNNADNELLSGAYTGGSANTINGNYKYIIIIFILSYIFGLFWIIFCLF